MLAISCDQDELTVVWGRQYLVGTEMYEKIYRCLLPVLA